jgi:hypothetical protein
MADIVVVGWMVGVALGCWQRMKDALFDLKRKALFLILDKKVLQPL